LPPQSVEAEQAVLGGLLIDNRAWERVVGMLSERDFYRDDHRRIYLHIQALIDKNRPADMVEAKASERTTPKNRLKR